MQRYINKPYYSLINTSHKLGISYAQLLSVHPQIKNIVLEAPPSQLKVIEKSAESIMHAADIQDWNRINNLYSVLKNDFEEVKPILIENLISPSLTYRLDILVTDLGEAIDSKKLYETKKLANQITLQVSYILDYYETKLPTNIDRLSFLGREIILNVEKNDWEIALDNVDYINVIWKSLEPKLIGVNEQNTKKLSQAITSLEQSIKSKNSAQTIEQANQILNQVHILEEVYM